MKRDRRLHRLSWGHQHVLAFSRTVKLDFASLSPAWFRVFWEKELAPHFRGEEEILFPEVERATSSLQADLERLRSEHVEIKKLFEEIGGAENLSSISGLAARTAGLLTAHTRFEERAFFPKVEEVLSEAQLEQVGKRLSHLLGGEPS